MKVTPTALPEVLHIEPRVFGDARGYFMETWSAQRYHEHGLPECFVQDNLSRSQQHTLRGLHLQQPHGQGKLVFALEGEIFDVAVDVRVGSPRFGKWVGVKLSGDRKDQLYVPEGFAHGFCVISKYALIAYKCTESYHPEAELGIAWNDPELAIGWPTDAPDLSDKDMKAPRLSEVERNRLPQYG